MKAPKSNIFSLAIVFLFAVACVPRLELSTPVYDANGVLEVDVLRFMPFGVAAVLISGLPMFSQIYIGSMLAFRRDRAWLATSLIVLMIILISLLSFRFASAGYAAVFAFIALNFWFFWQQPSKVRLNTFRLLAILLLSYLLAALAIYGMPVNRWIGGIHPNLYGASLVPCALFGLIGFRRAGWLFVGITFYLAVLVSSRYAIIAIFLMAFLFFLVRARFSSKISTVLLPVLSCGVVALIAYQWGAIDDLLQLSDPSRGLESGMTGRSDLNAYFWQEIQGYFLIGHGFRARDQYFATHNGYLNAILENGLLIGAALILLTVWKIWALLYRPLMRDPKFDRESVGVGCGFVSVALCSFFQPQLINFGDTLGLTFVLLLVYSRSRAAGRTDVAVTPRIETAKARGVRRLQDLSAP